MASTTTNYGLHKIDLTDAPPDITVLNQNWDTIDSELKELNETIDNLDASDVDSIKLYTSLSELGLTDATAKPISIVLAMESSSMLLAQVGSGADNFPTSSGLLTVIKRSNNYARFEWQSHNNSDLQDDNGILYVGYYNGAKSTPWTGWHEVALANNFLPIGATASDVGAVPLNGSVSMTGTLKYNDGTTTHDYYGTHNITKGTASLTAGTSALGSGCIYLQYE